MQCPKCGLDHITLNGKRHDGLQGYKCSDCGKQFCERTGTFMYRKRFPELAIRIAIFFNLFISSKRQFLDLLPETYQKHYSKKLFLILHGDEKFIKVKGSKDDFAY